MKEEDLKNKSKELLEVSPYGKVPVVVVDGRSIYESAVIGEYLDELYPEVKLMPDDPYERAQVRIWTDYVATRLSGPQARIRKADKPEDAEDSWPKLHEALEYIERHLKSTEGPWFVGGKFGMADINFLPFIDRLPAMDASLMEKYPAIKSWHDAFRERKSYQSTLTDV
jgi:glutathione S-transferase